MTYTEAKDIYDHVHSIVSVFGGDLYKECMKRNIPEKILIKILKEEKKLDIIINSLADIEERHKSDKKT